MIKIKFFWQKPCMTEIFTFSGDNALFNKDGNIKKITHI